MGVAGQYVGVVVTGLVQITAPHFCAGAVFDLDRCIHAAPILFWMKGKHWRQIKPYLDQKGWQYELPKNLEITP